MKPPQKNGSKYLMVSEMDMNALQDSGLLETPRPSFDLFWCEDQHGIDPKLSTKCSVLTYEAPDEASFYEASPSFIVSQL